MDNNTEENAVFIQVKREFIESENIKEEPPDDYYSSEAIENVTVKIEQCNEEEESSATAAQERFAALPDTLFARAESTQQPRRTKKQVKYDSSDDYSDYEVPKKKGKEIIKKTYSTKAKRKENDYTEEVTQHIEVLNISEEERLREHREAWHARQHMRYTCQVCAVGYVMREPYEAHMRLHAAPGKYVCDICKCGMHTAKHLYKHRLRHHRRYRCALCGAMHKEKETAASHVMSEHSGRAFTCTHCGKGFKRPSYLKKHIQQQHEKSENYECRVCQRVFHDKTSLRCHVRTHDDQTKHPPVQSVVCDICSTVFLGKTKLRRHMRVHGPSAHVCHCGASFKSIKGFRLHRENVHGTPQFVERAPCPFCERVCANAVLMRQHIRRMHTEKSKKYECDYCHRLYFSKSEIRAHIAWTHTRVRTNAHTCHCGRVFRTRTLLKNHVDIHHNNIVPERSHVCHCGKGFTSKQVLTRHMRSHTDLTYPCPECGLQFRTEAYVKVHHQLRHLNMTRAQIKALKKPRQLAYVTGMKPMSAVKPASEKVRAKRKKKVKVDVQNDVPVANSGIQVPLFDFVELKREIVDYQEEVYVKMAATEEDKFSDELLRMMEAQIAMDAFSENESMMDCASDSEDDMDEPPLENPSTSGTSNQFSDVVWSSEKFEPKVLPFKEKPMEINPTLLIEDTREIDYFLHFFDPEIAGIIVNSINQTYRDFVADEDNQSDSHLRQWHDLTVPEFYIFLTMCMLMTRNKRLRLDEHWSTDHLLYSPIFGNLMQRMRFMTLLFLLRTPTSAAQVNILDTLIQHARRKFRNIVKHPSKTLNVDQYNIPFKGEIYTKREAKKSGVKLYFVRDLKTGFVIDFTLYFGGKADQVVLSNLTAPEEQIVNLLKPFFNTHRIVFVDDRFTSPRLFKRLYENNLYACGRTSQYTPGMPSFVRNLEQGEVSVGYSNPLTAIQWHQRSSMLTTAHDDSLKNTHKRDKITGNVIKKPFACLDYSKTMRTHSADMSDFMISAIKPLKPLHWHKKLIFHVVDLHVLNAYQSFVSTKKDKGRTVFGVFQAKLMRQLIETYANGQISLDEPSLKPARALDKPIHVLPPIAAQHMPTRGEKYQRCKVCAKQKKRRDTIYMCVICQVYLCACPCFLIHHSQ